MDPPSLANAAIALLRAYAEDASLAGVDPLRRAVGGCFDPGVAEVDAESAALLHTRVAEDHAFALELERLVVEIEDLGEVEVEIVEGHACALRKSRTWPEQGDEGAGPHSLAVASEQGPPLGHGALDWFERERANLVVAVARAYEAGAYDTAWRLADGLVGFFDTRSHWDDWVTTHRLAVQAAQIVDPRAEAVTLRNLAHVYRYQGLVTEAAACYTQALERFRQVGDRLGEADVIHGIGLIHHDRACSHLERALGVFVQLGAVEADDVRRLQAEWGCGPR
ncbi:MAG TPA: tetratricopeptide repeat protein [Streptosporangiaceae bacterium]